MSIRNNYLGYFLVFFFAFLVTPATWAAQGCPKDNLTAYKITFIEDDGKKISSGEIQLPDLSKVVDEFCGYWKHQFDTFGEEKLYEGHKGDETISISLYPHMNDAGTWFRLSNNKQWFQEGQLMADSIAGSYQVGRFAITNEPPPNIVKLDHIYTSDEAIKQGKETCKAVSNYTRCKFYFLCTEKLKELEKNLNNFSKMMIPTFSEKAKTYPDTLNEPRFNETTIKYYEKLKTAFEQDPNIRPLDKIITKLILEAKFLEAEKLLLSEIEKQKKLQKTPNHQLANDYYRLTLFKELQADFPSSYKYIKAAVKYNPNNSLYLVMLGDKYIFAVESPDSNKVAEYYERALASDQANYGENHEKVVEDWNRLSNFWLRHDNYSRAIPYLEKVVNHRRKISGSTDPITEELERYLQRLKQIVKEQNG